MMAMLTQYMGAKYSSQQGGAAAVSARFDKLSGIIRLLMDGAATARQQMSLSYWVRSLQLGNAYAMEIRAMMFPESANIWLSNAIRDQRFASLLLPPVLPYPEEGFWPRLSESRQTQGKPGNVRAGAETLPQPRRSAGNHEKGPRRGQIILFNKTH